MKLFGSIFEKKKKPNGYLINRDLSWLKFNIRVLEEANNKSNPTLERIKFLSISGNNLDEFLMVRLAGLNRMMIEKIPINSFSNLSNNDFLNKIMIDLKNIHSAQLQIWVDLKKELKKKRYFILKIKELKKKDKLWLKDYFQNEIQPLLTPIAIFKNHSFPYIANSATVVSVELDKKKLSLIQIPSSLPRFIKIENLNKFIPIEEVIMQYAQNLFPEIQITNIGIFRIIRDSELEYSDEDDLLSHLQKSLKKRKLGEIISFSYIGLNKNIVLNMSELLNIKNENFIVKKSFLGFVDLKQLADLINDKNLLYNSYYPRFPERIEEFDGNCFAAIKKKELVIHHPYETFEVVVRFLKQAATDPKVLLIKQTFYRIGNQSEVANALIEAAENGKNVIALIELKARFDEAENMEWAHKMQAAGVKVFYSNARTKIHAKLAQVVRKEQGKLITYSHVGTGNYHSVTSRVYSDLSYFTANKKLSQELGKVFNYMKSLIKPENVKNVTYAPINLRTNLVNLIEKEIEFAKNKMPAEIWMKLNSLVDKKIIDLLCKASKNNVKINLIVRGICCLIPGIKDISENIKVKSIVGRFLEHSRIYCFSNGKKMPSRSSKVFISSADLMPRNLDRRIEILLPINNKTVHQQILDQIMVANLKDNQQSWFLNNEGNYEKIKNNSKEKKFSAHQYFMKNPSLSGRGKSLEKLPVKKI